MTFEEFDEQGFGPGMKCRYGGDTYEIVEVNFPERLIGLAGFIEGDDAIHWSRCENVELIWVPGERSCEATNQKPDVVVRVGDYVHASKYEDKDPHDPWRIGFVCRIIEDKRGRAYIIGAENGSWNDFREYKYVEKITAAQGREYLEAHKEFM